ncbi:hemolysin family protein [Bosea sp. TWI1241]|uniref:hemolysin family protein n=1 Tax=Bosea sp. TWI1241 TaxID=3148904 RepID=UPI003208F4B8
MSDDPRSPGQDAPGRGLAHWLGHFLDNLGLRHVGSVREDITEALAQQDGGVADLSPQERAMLSNVLGMRERRVDDVMIPRADIVAVPIDASLAELMARFRAAGHSRLPVYGESLDDPRGMIHIRDFMDFIAMSAVPDGATAGNGPGKVTIDLATTIEQANIQRPVLYVPPSMPAVDLLVRMQATRTHIALVIDEYGGTDGLISIEDLIEIVVGEIEDEHDHDEGPTIAPAGEDAFIADARATLEELREATGIDLSRAEVADDVDTLGGLIVTLAGHVPARGEEVEGPEGLLFEVLDADPRRVKRLRIRRRDPVATGEASLPEAS